MSKHFIQAMVPPPVAVPRGADWAAHALRTPLNALQRIGPSIWASLEAIGRRRAARELLNLAERWQSTNPDLAQAMRQAAQHDASRH